MKYLFFTNTPAHVHLYRNAMTTLQDRGHEVLALGRDYGCTLDLLEYYDLPYELYGRCDTTKLSVFRELPRHYASILRRTHRYDPDLIFGIGSYAALAGGVTRTPAVIVLDSETTTLDHAISSQFAHSFLTPHAFTKNLGDNHYVFNGFKECAYLHPDVYEPQTNIRAELGVDPDEEYVVLRFNAFGSHHDFGHWGFNEAERRELIDQLSEHATVFVSDEGGNLSVDNLPAESFDLHPALLHDALAEASLLVADTQTMVTEAALLGTPAIRSNSFVGDDDMGNFRELEAHDLIHNLREFEPVLDTAVDLVTDPRAKSNWKRRRDEYMTDKVNLTDLIVDVALDAGALRRLDQKQTREEPEAVAPKL